MLPLSSTENVDCSRAEKSRLELLSASYRESLTIRAWQLAHVERSTFWKSMLLVIVENLPVKSRGDDVAFSRRHPTCPSPHLCAWWSHPP
jgi:hypothetical protein